MKNILLYTIAFLGLFLCSCQEDEVFEWRGRDCIHFYQEVKNPNDLVFEMGFSFGLTDIMDTVIRIPVSGSGEIKNYDRYFSFVVDSVSGVEGVHYDLPEKGIFPADSATGYIPVPLHRVYDDDSLYCIRFQLVSNDEFEVNLPTFTVSGKEKDLTRYTLNYSSAIAPPQFWTLMEKYYLGYFSLAKYNLWYEMSGMDLQTSPNASAFVGVATLFENYIKSKISEGKESALKDPQNHAAGEEGYMTMRGKNGYKNPIPQEWFENE